MNNRTTRLLLTAATLSFAGLAQADIQPTGATDGVIFDNSAANITNITAPDNAIIDYAAFNVAGNQTVMLVDGSGEAASISSAGGENDRDLRAVFYW